MRGVQVAGRPSRPCFPSLGPTSRRVGVARDVSQKPEKNIMNRPGQPTAMISSSALDLPDHRRQARDACLRVGVFPICMETLPARDVTAIEMSLQMVDTADIYICILAHRYGWIPKGKKISLTELEFNRAVERHIPILVFLIHNDHPLTIDMVETSGVAQKKLSEFKSRATQGRIRAIFRTPDELRGQIVSSLTELSRRDEEALGTGKRLDFHPPNLIPLAPAPTSLTPTRCSRPRM